MAAGATRPSRATPWVVWGVGLAVYVVAVANRSSFGVAGIEAAFRFNVQSTVLSLFVVVQLTTYAVFQLPMGMALDAWGPRRLLVTGSAIMAVGQAGMAFAPTVGLAIGARVLIGAGDAAIFVSAARLVLIWFPLDRASLLLQVTGLVGQLGQVVSALPFAALLHGIGWAPAFGSLAAFSALVAVAAVVMVKRCPNETRVTSAPWKGLGPTLTGPGTWLGFFTHMLGAVSNNVFILMWGVPFMAQGLKFRPQTTSTMLTVAVITGLVVGPVIGQITAKRPRQRSTVALIVACGVVVAWALLLIPAQGPSTPVVGVAIVLIAIGGPASIIGLDLAASYAAPERRSTAQGVANMGGFVSAVLVMVAVGMVLDRMSDGGAPTLAEYRLALAVVAVPMLVAVVGILLTRRPLRLKPTSRQTTQN